MNHREARLYLTDLVLGELDAPTELDLQAHIDSCHECREALSVCGLFRLAAPDLVVAQPGAFQQREPKPSSSTGDRVARFASGSGGLEHNSAVFDHRTGGTAAEGLSVSSAPRYLHGSRGGRQVWIRSLASAAALFVVVGVSSYAIRHQRSGAISGGEPPTSVIDTNHKRIPTRYTVDDISNSAVEGDRQIDVVGDMPITQATIKKGANVVFRSNGRIVIGNGFHVESNANLVVETGTSRKRDFQSDLQS